MFLLIDDLMQYVRKCGISEFDQRSILANARTWPAVVLKNYVALSRDEEESLKKALVADIIHHEDKPPTSSEERMARILVALGRKPSGIEVVKLAKLVVGLPIDLIEPHIFAENWIRLDRPTNISP